MPTSHAASRMVLLVLVTVAAAVLLVIGVDRAWSPISGQVQKAWSALRAALPGDTEARVSGLG